MTTTAASLTTSLNVDLPTLRAFRLFAPELDFVPIDQLGDRQGPYVYVHVIGEEAVAYIGKAEAKRRPAGRPSIYAFWVDEYRVKGKGKTRDPRVNLAGGDLDLLDKSPIVRFASRHDIVVHVASVAGTDVGARAWEGRLQAISGTLTANESLIGGSAWEANGWTHRGRGYRWVKDRILELRTEGAL